MKLYFEHTLMMKMLTQAFSSAVIIFCNRIVNLSIEYSVCIIMATVNFFGPVIFGGHLKKDQVETIVENASDSGKWNIPLYQSLASLSRRGSTDGQSDILSGLTRRTHEYLRNRVLTSCSGYLPADTTTELNEKCIKRYIKSYDRAYDNMANKLGRKCR